MRKAGREDVWRLGLSPADPPRDHMGLRTGEPASHAGDLWALFGVLIASLQTAAGQTTLVIAEVLWIILGWERHQDKGGTALRLRVFMCISFKKWVPQYPNEHSATWLGVLQKPECLSPGRIRQSLRRWELSTAGPCPTRDT